MYRLNRCINRCTFGLGCVNGCRHGCVYGHSGYRLLHSRRRRRRWIRKVPRPGHHRRRHDPRRRTHHTLALVGTLDRIPLKVDVLRDIADEREDLGDALVCDRERGEEVDDGMCDGGYVREKIEGGWREYDFKAPPV
jgi:hypothetical protein